MSEQHSGSGVEETAPLLPNTRGGEESQGTPTPENDAWQRGFHLATIAAVVSGILTLVLLVASVIVMSGRPSNYYPSFDLYYYFAPTAGFSIIAILHSITMLLGTSNGIAPQQGFTGILVDIFAGLFFLFQSLYSMQQLLYYPNRCYPNGPGPDSDCEAWRRRAEPLFWIYLLVTLIFGVVHAILLFLRASRFKRSGRVLHVQLVGQDGRTVQYSG